MAPWWEQELFRSRSSWTTAIGTARHWTSKDILIFELPVRFFNFRFKPNGNRGNVSHFTEGLNTLELPKGVTKYEVDTIDDHIEFRLRISCLLTRNPWYIQDHKSLQAVNPGSRLEILMFLAYYHKKNTEFTSTDILREFSSAYYLIVQYFPTHFYDFVF